MRGVGAVMNLVDLIRAFLACVRAGGHDFKDETCTRCGAKKGGTTLGRLIKDEMNKRQ